jgi:ubiquinone/menaquinone biosynthesis C-methylase UbiE
VPVLALKQVKEIYDNTAESYDYYVTPCRLCQFLVLTNELTLKGTERVLEVGSGPGELSLLLAKRLDRGEVVGVDVSEKMVVLSKGRSRALMANNVTFVVGDALSLQFLDGSFDVVVSSYVIHWVLDPLRYLREMARVLKRGGQLAIIAPSQEMYGDLRRAFKEVAYKYRKYYDAQTMAELIGLKVLSDKEMIDLLPSAGLVLKKDFQLNFKERLSPELYMKRVNAITNERYLEPLPVELKDKVRTELMKTLTEAPDSGRFLTERSVFLIAEKRNRS